MMSINMTLQTSQQKPAMQANHMNPQELTSILSEGLRSFPLTDFDAASIKKLGAQ